MSFPAIPAGYGVPLIDLTTDLPPGDVLDALDLRYASVSDITADTGWTAISTFGTGWSATSSHPPRLRKVGKRIDAAGAFTRTATSGALADLCTIPAGFRLTGAYSQYFIGTSVTSGGQALELYLSSADHKIQIPAGYISATLGSGVVVPFVATWFED